ncbi:cupin domain-containing protein [Nocardia sp. XZ_19_369]|uniref:cupin domain-containing protein n=1 Tax=Nocardia sp. XZ_19_369 TaxID=2769487 RepID=UPI0027D28FEC|nr:cupin domain-containing protein [Nocardia sp. XZ_19_369]
MSEKPVPEDLPADDDEARLSRRRVIGTGAALGGAALGGALAATVGGAARAEHGSATPASDASAKLDTEAHLFRLTSAEPNRYDGGTLRGAHEGTFPVLTGQQASVYYVELEIGGLREPHWHPTAWELNYIISGTADWTILGTHPDGTYRNDAFEAKQGDLVFVPQGFFHYFANSSTEQPLQVLVVFNTSAQEPNDDIGIVATVNSLPREILAAAFGVPVAAFGAVPTEVKPVVITKRT